MSLRTNFFLLICILGSFISTAQTTRKLASFSGIEVGGNLTVQLIPGQEEKIVITMISGDEEEIKSDIENGLLKLKVKYKILGSSKTRAKVDVHYRSLSSIETSAGSSLKSTVPLTKKEMKLEASSGSKMVVELKADEVTVDASSGASITVTGSCKSLEVDASSGASIKAEKLSAQSVNAEGSSGASITVWATEKLSGDASSGATIRYKGTPSQKQIHTSAAGSIKEI